AAIDAAPLRRSSARSWAARNGPAASRTAATLSGPSPPHTAQSLSYRWEAWADQGASSRHRFDWRASTAAGAASAGISGTAIPLVAADGDADVLSERGAPRRAPRAVVYVGDTADPLDAASDQQAGHEPVPVRPRDGSQQVPRGRNALHRHRGAFAGALDRPCVRYRVGDESAVAALVVPVDQVDGPVAGEDGVQVAEDASHVVHAPGGGVEQVEGVRHRRLPRTLAAPPRSRRPRPTSRGRRRPTGKPASSPRQRTCGQPPRPRRVRAARRGRSTGRPRYGRPAGRCRTPSLSPRPRR